MNTLEVPSYQVAKSKKMNDIVKIIGLKYAGETTKRSMRYGKIIIMCDADHDGYSIVAQLLTMFMTHFPEVIEWGMVYLLVPPKRVYKNKEGNYVYFYNDEDFKNASIPKGVKVKYLKGLGSMNEDMYYDMIQNPLLYQITSDYYTEECIDNWMGSSKESVLFRQKMVKNG